MFLNESNVSEVDNLYMFLKFLLKEVPFRNLMCCRETSLKSLMSIKSNKKNRTTSLWKKNWKRKSLTLLVWGKSVTISVITETFWDFPLLIAMTTTGQFNQTLFGTLHRFLSRSDGGAVYIPCPVRFWSVVALGPLGVFLLPSVIHRLDSVGLTLLSNRSKIGLMPLFLSRKHEWKKKVMNEGGMQRLLLWV